jgi:hypothetical protein
VQALPAVTTEYGKSNIRLFAESSRSSPNHTNKKADEAGCLSAFSFLWGG